MATLSYDPAIGSPAAAGVPAFARRMQLVTLWLLLFSGFFVKFEPSPYEVVFLVAAAVFVATRARIHASTAPLVLLLVAYNVGGLLSVIPFLDNRPAVTFTAVTIYLSITSIFFALCMLEDTEARFAAIKSGYIAAAIAASLFGIIGYFDIGGTGEFLTRYGRASSTFKDPNVYSTFLVPAIAFMAQDLLLARRHLVAHGAILLFLTFGLFLSFSRGAWGNLLATLAVIALLTFLTSTSARLRMRIVAVCLAGTVALALGLLVALSFEEVRNVFELRASLEQDYDLGATGRFGAHLRSIPYLLDNPNGLGPLQFTTIFGQDPHNVYINAFSSYGWIGGFSYFTIIVLTLIVGFRTVLTRSPYQAHAIAIYAPLLIVILQGIQIDTDHWRHLYVLLGLAWGLFAVTVPYRRTKPPVAA